MVSWGTHVFRDECRVTTYEQGMGGYFHVGGRRGRRVDVGGGDRVTRSHLNAAACSRLVYHTCA